MNINVSLKQIAGEIGFHPSSIRKAAVTRGFRPFRLSDGNNKPLFLKYEDAMSLKGQILNERSNAIASNSSTFKSKMSGVYLIEVPSFSGKNRIKIGWSDSLNNRIATYRTIVPDLIVRATWLTSDSWCERAAIKCAERLGRKVHTELFEFDDVDGFIRELADLFLRIGKEVSRPDE